MWVHWVFLVAWTMHGLGHVAGMLAPTLPQASGFRTNTPWVLPGDTLVTGPVGQLWAIIWIAALLLICASSYGLWAGDAWWRLAALFGALASLVAILPWARTVPPGALIGAAFDIGVIVMLLVPLDGLLALVEAQS